MKIIKKILWFITHNYNNTYYIDKIYYESLKYYEYTVYKKYIICCLIPVWIKHDNYTSLNPSKISYTMTYTNCTEKLTIKN